MKRNDAFGAAVDLFGAGKNGFTGGMPGVTPASVLDASMPNNWQEEIARAIEVFGGKTCFYSLSNFIMSSSPKVTGGAEEFRAREVVV